MTQGGNLTSECIELVYIAAEQGALGQPLHTYIAHMLDYLIALKKAFMNCMYVCIYVCMYVYMYVCSVCM